VLGEAADVEAIDVRSPVQQRIDGPGVAVEGKDDVDRVGEPLRRERRRVLTDREQPHEFHVVDDPDVQMRDVAAQQLSRGQHFHGGDVSSCGQDDVREVVATTVQNGAVASRVEERGQSPRRGQRTGLRLAVADHAATNRFGSSKAAPAACSSAQPSSPPSWTLPGMCTPAWLLTPPGVENWRTSRVRPARSRDTT
jgi:hypothetical protein